MKQVIKYKSREEWLANRSNGIGASEVGTILGLNPFETPYQLWRRKKGLDAPKIENFAMRAGHYLEDAVAHFFADDTEAYIIKNTTDDFTIRSVEKPFLQVSPDRLFWWKGSKHTEKRKAVLECKTTQLQIDPDNLPKHWFCQLQMNMGVGEYQDGALAWLTQGREFNYRIITFDKDFYEWMVGEVEDYWYRYIVGDEEPQATTADDILMKFPHEQHGKIIQATEDIQGLLYQLRTLKDTGKELQLQTKEIEDNIKVYLGDAEALVDNTGKVLATWKTAKPTKKFDLKALEADYSPHDLARYYYEQEGTRRLLIK